MMELIVIGICLLLNALFACFEMAFVTVSKAHILSLFKKGSRAAGLLLRQRDNPERTLSVVQIGITLVGMISAAVGGAGAEEMIAPVLQSRFGFSENLAEGLSIALIVLPLTYLSVVLGELVPKSIALRFSERVALGGARWSAIAEKVLAPFVWVLEVSTKIVLRLLSLSKSELPHGTGMGGVDVEGLSKQAQQYILNLAHVEQRRVADVMTPWGKVQTVDIEDKLEAVRDRVIHSGHTRLPVVGGKEVLGLLHTKELFALMHAGDSDWTSLVRPVVVLQAADAALSALRQLQGQRSHLGVVFSSMKLPLGIVSTEDVIEGIVGELFDEDDDGTLKRLLGKLGRFNSALR
jgi:putative hemolysin